MHVLWQTGPALLMSCLLAGTLAPAAPPRPAGRDGATLKAQIDKLAQPIVTDKKSVGISIGILDEAGGSHFFTYGKVSAEGERAPDADTLFEIGSITKCFTSILLADMVGKGEVGLRDPASKYLPEGVQLPRVADQAITLEDLATYSSGLPRMPDNIGGDLPSYSLEKMYAFLTHLAQREKDQSPQRHFLYSNLGFALLGDCLARRAGENIRPLIERRICKALGMPSTCFEPMGSLKERVAAVHGPAGRPVAAWENGCIAPSGMVRSSARDMVRFVQVNVGVGATPLRAALQLAQQPRYETGPPARRKIGLGWFISPETGFVMKDGGTRGSSANILFDPQRKIGVVVLMNQARAPATRLSVQVMRLLHGDFDPKSISEPPMDDGKP